MTGPMQVFGRGALSFSERMAVELDYIDNLSLSRDLRIIGQTIPAIIRGTRGARIAQASELAAARRACAGEVDERPSGDVLVVRRRRS